MSTSNHTALFDRSRVKNGAPDFNAVTNDTFMPAIKDAIAIAEKRIAAIKSDTSKPNFENTILALETADEELNDTLSIFFNLLSAESNEEMRALAQKISPITTKFSNDISLDADLFKRIDAVWNDRHNLNLTTEQMSVLEKTWKGFVRSGAKLGEKEQKRLRALNEELSLVGLSFQENMLNSTNAFAHHVTDKKAVAGIPEMILAAAAEKAKEKGHKDGWLFTLDAPIYIPVMTYGEDRALRETMWTAFANRAHKDQFDNRDNIKKIVALRHERANLLGYDSHADYVLEERMAKTKETVFDFLTEIVDTSKPSAQEDLKRVQALAEANDNIKPSDFKPWDVTFYAEKLKQKEYNFDAEELRPYFELDSVLDGVFAHASKLFGIEARESSDYPTYHKDVKTYEIFDKDSGDFYGVLYADFFPRDGKQAGAWKTSFRDRGLNKDGDMDCPLIAIVCNFTKPAGNDPSLLTFDEVETLFHEFGHALHGMLTQADHKTVSGTSVLWDFVELPSQIMENWLTHKETLDMFAKHYKTGASIPQDLLDKLKASQNFMAGNFMMRQASLGLLDMRWHTADPSKISDVEQFEIDAGKDTALMPREPSCTSTSFGHIFKGGYSAGYYSYFWAEVLDADAFELFEEKGLYDQKTALAFRDLILAKGGSEDPAKLYRDFRGRDADPKALLRKKGLIPANTAPKGPKAA